MIRILHLETSTKSCSVALSVNGEVIAAKETLTEEFTHSENLTVFVQVVLKQVGIGLSDIHAVSVASGPGSYTGLRIGVSTAKGFCYALGIPLIAIDSLTALKEIAAPRHPGKTICAMIDARRKEVFSAVFDGKGELIKSISADILDEGSYSEYEPFVFVGDGAAKMAEDWTGRKCQADLTIHASATGQAKIAYEKFVNGSFEDVAYFEPFYLKDFMVGKPASSGNP